jgi:hypothetical protein
MNQTLPAPLKIDLSEEDSRTYNAAQLAQKLGRERRVVWSQDRLRKILKARGWV